MADRYWVGGTDNWNATAGTKWSTTSGGAGGASVPTLSDNVFFDAASGAVTVTITATANCDNLNFTGFTGTIAGTSALNVYGSLTLSTGMTRSWSGTLTMRATTTGKTITTNGKTLANITFAGAGGGWTLQDAFTIAGAGDITHTNGTLDTNGVAVSASSYLNTGTATRVLTLGASTFTCTNNGTAFSISSATGMTLNAGTSTIVLSSINPTFDGAGFTYYNLSSTASSQTNITLNINGTNTFNNVSITPISLTGYKIVNIGDTQIINGTLTVAGASLIRRTLLKSNVLGTTRTLTVATLSGDNADYQDIALAGGASPASPAGAGDREGNSGINFPAAKTVYWNLAGTQNWTASGWALSSGGTPDPANFPLAQDTAVFDNAGSVGTITVNAPNQSIKTVDMSLRTNAMTISVLSGNFIVYKNFLFGTGVTASGTSTLQFQGRTTQTITSNGVQFPCPININNFGSVVQLADALSLSSARTLTLTSGTFNAVTYNVTSGSVSVSGSTTRTLSMGSGTWTLSGTGTVWNAGTVTGLTFNKDTANIVLSDTSTSARTFAGGGLTYNKLTIGGATGTSTLTFTGSNVFSEIDSTKTVAHTISFTSGTTTTVTTWSVNGSSGNLVSIRAVTAGVPATLAKAGGGSVIVNYADIKDNTGSPVATWFATNSVDSGNNLNWVFLAAAASAAFLMFFT